jgi:hypothetical protein
LVGGEGLLGVGIALVAYVMGRAPEGVGTEWAGAAAPWLSLLLFLGLVGLFWRLTTGRKG